MHEGKKHMPLPKAKKEKKPVAAPKMAEKKEKKPVAAPKKVAEKKEKKPQATGEIMKNGKVVKVYTGPRGGEYTLSPEGKKTYI